MSKTLEKLSEIERLPIFPLPLVLMPNELLPLRIFEEKYRKMLRDVAGTSDIFGIVRSENSQSFDVRPPVNSVGCLAEIRDIETMDDGTSNIVTIGTTRFRLLEYLDTDEPYLEAVVEFFEDETEDPEILDPLAEEVFGLFERIAKAAFLIGGNRGRFPAISRTDPESFSFLTAAAFNFENDFKDGLIAMTSTSERLERLREILSKAVDTMEETAITQKAAKSNGHSTKKLDI